MRLTRVVVAVLLLSLALVGWSSALAAEKGPIRLGVMLPLSGPSAASGQDMRMGYILAQEEINKAGGVLGRQIELIFEDDKGDPATGVASFEKLMVRDKVGIVLGGISSTVTYALSAPAKKYKPIMAWTGAASTSVEEAFADSDWFFHYHPWEYHNLKATTDFFVSTGAKTIAVAYEDGLFGAGGRKVAVAMFMDAGLKVVFDESFKSGSGDFAPLLAKAKKTNPDIFYWIGYAGDAIPMTTQAKEQNFSPKLIYGVPPSWPEGFGSLEASNYIGGLTFWTPDIPSKESKEFVARFQKRWNQLPQSYWAPLAYTNLVTVADAIKRAGTTDKEDVIKALEQTKYASPLGRTLTFKPSRIIKHQGFTDWVSFQWIKGKQEIVYPASLATAKLVYPVPAWNER